MNATELRAALSLAAIYITRMLGLFMVLPVLAILAVDYDNFDPLYLGLAIGAYGLTQALLQIPFGMLSDKIGRKPVIMLGLVLFTSGSIVASQATDMTWLIIGRVLQGSGAIAGAIMALAADVTRESQRTKVMAIIGIAIGMSFYLSLLLGPTLADSYGLSGLFVITSGLGVLSMLLLWFLVPNASNIAPSGDTLPRSNLLIGVLRDKPLRVLYASVCILHFYIAVLFVQLPQYLLANVITLESQWQVYLPILLVSIIGLVGLMRLAKIRPKHVLTLSMVAMLLALGMLGAGTHFGIFSMPLIFTIGIVFFTGFNYLEAHLPALLSSLAPAGKKGSAMGVYASFQFFGAFLGGLISGLMISSFSDNILYTVCIVIGVVWLVILQQLPHLNKFKRVTLHINLGQWSVSEIGDKLHKLQGVADITIVEAEHAAYLKVDANTFDINQAQQAVQ